MFNANYPNFHILGFGGGLAPNTPITISIATYTGPNLTGTVTFTSTITFDCTTGQIERLARAPPLLTDVPALDSTGLALLAMLVGLAGAACTARPTARCAAVALVVSPARIRAKAPSSARRRILLEDPPRSTTDIHGLA